MTTKQNAKELNKIDRQIIRLMKQSLAECTKPPAKRFSTAIKRCGKIIRLAIQMRMLEMQKRMIIAQPVPKFPKGGIVSDGPTFDERGRVLIQPNCSVKPGCYQDCEVVPRQHDNITII